MGVALAIPRPKQATNIITSIVTNIIPSIVTNSKTSIVPIALTDKIVELERCEIGLPWTTCRSKLFALLNEHSK